MLSMFDCCGLFSKFFVYENEAKTPSIELNVMVKINNIKNNVVNGPFVKILSCHSAEEIEEALHAIQKTDWSGFKEPDCDLVIQVVAIGKINNENIRGVYENVEQCRSSLNNYLQPPEISPTLAS